MPSTPTTQTSTELPHLFRAARAAQNLTLREFGDALGVSHNLIALWETGARDITYERIIDWLRDPRPWVHGLGRAIANVKYAELLAHTTTTFAAPAPEGTAQ